MYYKQNVKRRVREWIVITACISLLAGNRFPIQIAWWGSLYPRIALQNAMSLVCGDRDVVQPVDEYDKDIPVKIKWKCLELLDWESFGKEGNGIHRD